MAIFFNWGTEEIHNSKTVVLQRNYIISLQQKIIEHFKNQYLIGKYFCCIKFYLLLHLHGELTISWYIRIKFSRHDKQTWNFQLWIIEGLLKVVRHRNVILKYFIMLRVCLGTSITHWLKSSLRNHIVSGQAPPPSSHILRSASLATVQLMACWWI